MKKELDIAVISDAHLGTYGCHAKELLQYLKSIKTKNLILNGDFIDIWQFRKSFFPIEHLQVIQRILKMAANGTKIYYITGNHDDKLRRYSDFSSGNIHLRDKLILQLNGQKYWFFHGDIFDTLTTLSPLLAKMGGKGYDWLIIINRWVNKLRVRLGWGKYSFAGKVKNKVKQAIKYIGDFEKTAIKLAAEQGYDYVICGHIHKPQQREELVDGQRVHYLNSGDWVENLTALEYRFDKWSIYHYDEAEYEYKSPRLKVTKEPQPNTISLMDQEWFSNLKLDVE